MYVNIRVGIPSVVYITLDILIFDREERVVNG